MHRAPPAAPFEESPDLGPADWRVAVNLGAAFLFALLVVLAVVFDRLAAKGVLVVAFLSVILAYLIAPVVERLRRTATPLLGGRKPSRALAVTVLYAAMVGIVLPLWLAWGPKVVSQVPDVARAVPRHVARFVGQVRASERWHEGLTVEKPTRRVLRGITGRLSQRVQIEVREVGAEAVRARRIVPWLLAVPIIAFVLVARWSAFRRSAARALPTPHLQWRTDQFLQHVNAVLAAYTRATASSALIVGVVCGVGFALMKLPNAAMLGIVAGLLEMVPIAGPIAVAISATAVAGHQVVLVLAFLGALRIVQDYVIYPRLIRRAMHLHPVAVVVAIWLGAAIGGIVGVCLAIPVVGILQVALRHWREYREIERLVRAR